MSKKKQSGSSGVDAERLMAAWLKSLGYAVERRAGRTGLHRTKSGKVYSKSQDIFGCIDVFAVIATKPLRSANTGVLAPIMLVQVTTKNCVSSRKRKIEKIPWPHEVVARSLATICVCVHTPPKDGIDAHMWDIWSYEPMPQGGLIWAWYRRRVPFDIALLRKRAATSLLSADKKAKVEADIKKLRKTR